MGSQACNIEEYTDNGLAECGKTALWKHPRWPTGTYCDQHKESLEDFWPNNWTRIKENKDDK